MPSPFGKSPKSTKSSSGPSGGGEKVFKTVNLNLDEESTAGLVSGGFPSQEAMDQWNNKPKHWGTGKTQGIHSAELDPSKEIKLLKVGADIEEFLKDAKGNPVPVIGLIGGTKDSPLPILTTGYALQEDNVALEYNIPAAADKYQWIYSLMRIREEINERVAKHGLTPAIEASMRFTKEQLDHPQAKVFGCEPDFNVWEQMVNEKPDQNPDSATLRTAGAHVHVSFLIGGKVPILPPEGIDNLAVAEAMVMAMDIFLGVPFSIMDQDVDRQKMYGKAGAFRPKPYGIEYRVLSNYWTRSPKLMSYVYEGVQRAINYVNNYENPRIKLLDWKGLVYKSINDKDKDATRYLVDHFHIHLPAELAA